jgi:hypothetical protein
MADIIAAAILIALIDDELRRRGRALSPRRAVNVVRNAVCAQQRAERGGGRPRGTKRAQVSVRAERQRGGHTSRDRHKRGNMGSTGNVGDTDSMGTTTNSSRSDRSSVGCVA